MKIIPYLKPHFKNNRSPQNEPLRFLTHKKYKFRRLYQKFVRISCTFLMYRAEMCAQNKSEAYILNVHSAYLYYLQPKTSFITANVSGTLIMADSMYVIIWFT